MKKINLLVFCLFVFQVISSQRHLGNDMTNIVPPSPQSSEMAAYGNQPLNEYRGMAQISIPITSVKQNDIYSNLDLNYSKLGVKVNDIPNNVGVSWLLAAGGVITGTIYDLPDEMRIPAKRLLFENLYGINP